MTDPDTATTTEAAPFSTEEMINFMLKLEALKALDGDDAARAIATARVLERATNWILVQERAAWKAPIPALETVGEALGADGTEHNTCQPTPADYYDGDACMDACRLACRGRSGIDGHLVASAIQYLWRSGRKGAALPDVLKARDMVDRFVRELGGGK